jgi:phenylalanyl-tRNA synthetase beta chain
VKLPLSWLTSMVDVDLPLDELVTVMSLNGLEVEGVTAPGAGTAGVRTARVLHWQPHPDADKLRVVRVTGDGGDGEIELVCGAANFDVGDVVAHALPGGHVPGVNAPDGTRGLTLAARTIRGVTSHGMLASARELELGEDHAGILVLPHDTPLGADLQTVVPLGEPVIEVAVQADRGDHLSVLGVARDLAAILDAPWHAPEVPAPSPAPSVPVELRTDGCERFVTWRLDGVTVQPSPLWLAHRLVQCGMRPIDLVVDVTNYVMLELGQPLHAFDLDTVRGPSLLVRESTGDETLTTLDDQVRRLEPGDLVIDDAQRAVSLAGVMGGLDTEVTAGTSRVLLEAAVWDPRAIRRTSRRLGLVSEASNRFERRVDPDGADRAVARAACLLAGLGTARLAGSGRVDAASAPTWAQRSRITLEPARVRALLDVEVSDDTQVALLTRSGCDLVPRADQTLQVTAPSWRGDLQRPADLVEEIARLNGYDRIPSTLPTIAVTGGLTAVQRLEREVRTAALAAGFHEAVTRPFVGADAFVGVVPSEGRVVLANPLAKDASAMRPSLLEGLLQALRRNVGQGRAGTALVELGRIFRPVDDPLAAALDAVIAAEWRWRAPDGQPLPLQPRTIALAAQGLRLGVDWLDPGGHWALDDVLVVIAEVAERLAPPDDDAWRVTLEPTARDGLHPGRSAAVLLRGQEIGIVGQLHPDEADHRDLPEPVVVGELLLEPFLAAVPEDGYAPVSARALVKHPALTVDVALVADDAVPYAALEDAVRSGAGALLDELWWFDEYRGEQVGEGRRSVAVRLRLQSSDRQLTDEDAERVIGAVAGAAGELGATLRR